MSAWANAHDGTSLLTIRQHRKTLLAFVDRGECATSSALALARLIDLDGAAEDLRAALEAAQREATKQHAPSEKLALAIAQADYESGDLSAARLKLEALDQAALAEVRLTAALALVRIGDPQAQHQRLAHARDQHASLPLPAPWLSALLASTEAQVALSQRRISLARDHWQHALELALSYGGELEAAVAVGCLGNLELDQDDIPAAAAWFAEAVRLGTSVGATTVVAIFLGYHGWTLKLQGDGTAGEPQLSEAIVRCRQLGIRRFLYQFMCIQLASGTEPDDLAQREVQFYRTLSGLRATGDIERAHAIAPLSVLFQIGRAKHAKPSLAVRRLIGAYRALDVSPVSDDGRVVLRQTRRAYQQALKAVPGATLILAPGAHAGTGPAGSFDLRPNPTLARLLWALVEAWAEERTLDDSELIALTWPGETFVRDAASRRLQVGISTLRKRILGPVLKRIDGRYQLALDLQVSLAPIP